jgi:anti-sigma28 factor (negative regulator of flagellin synthesis)
VKIENSAVQLGSLTAADQVQQNDVRGGQKNVRTDHVQLSRFAQAYGDRTRVADLKASYEAGTYDVSAQKVAAGILNYMLN